MKKETICIQGGYKPGNAEPRQVPIIQSTTFKFDTCEFMGKLFNLEAAGYFYTRLSNPTNDYVAKKITELEGGVAGMLTSSGQAANFFAVFNLCNAGDHLISTSAIYGGTFNLFAVTLKKMGIETTFIPPYSDEDTIRKAIRPNTKLIFGETIANPSLDVFDFEKFVKVAHEAGIPVIVDNTFPTPINCRPIEFGVDIVTHSTTKYLDGHGVGVGGAIVDSGKFDWMAHKDRFPGLTTPDDSYHGLVYAEVFGKEGAFITKATAQLMRDLGSIQSPQNAFYLNLGIESLHVRIPAHCKNAQKVAEYLEKSDKVKSIKYPGLKSFEHHDLVEKYLPNGTCGVISFELNGGRDAAQKFMKALKLIAIETHVADARSCCLAPSITTHRQLTDEQLVAAGVSAGMVRLSVGIENGDDLLEDVKNALDSI